MDNSPDPSPPPENALQKLIDYLHHVPWDELQPKYGSSFGEAITNTYPVLLRAVDHLQADQIEASRADWVVSKNGKVVFRVTQLRDDTLARLGYLTQEELDQSNRNVAALFFYGLQRILEVDQVMQHYLKIKFRNNKKIIVTIQAPDQNG